MSCIRISRDELVWETRNYTFEESDWLNFLDRQRDIIRLNRGEDLVYNASQILAVTENLTFAEVVADYKNWDLGNYSIRIMQKRWWGNHQAEPVALGEMLLDEIRDYCYQADVVDTNYADDYREDITYEI